MSPDIDLNIPAPEPNINPEFQDERGRFKPNNTVGRKFKPGQSGNPAGKPKGIPNLSTVLERWLNHEVEDELGEIPGKLTMQDAIVLNLGRKAMNGDVSAAKELFERAHGKVAQNINQNISGDVDITID